MTWTQELRLGFRPELRFYEQRTSLLRLLEERDSLQAFRWTDQGISARLQDHADLRLTARSATVRVLSPRTSVDDVRQLVLLVLQALEPSDVIVVTFQAQCLAPVGAVFADIAAATGVLLEPEMAPEAQVTDWAMLVDGQSDSGKFTLEYGLIKEDEAVSRLMRTAGRVGGPSGDEEVLDIADLPECALFLDWLWSLNAACGDDLAVSVTQAWDRALSETMLLSERVKHRLGLAESTIKKEA